MLYAMLHALGRFLFKIAFKLRISGSEKLPKNSGYIVAPNHRSGLDIPVVGVALPKRMYSIAKKELFEKKLTGAFLKSLGAVPLNREIADIKAVKIAIELAKKGKVLLMFPEGTRSEVGPLQKAKKGTVYIATQARIPIVPTGIVGTERAFPKGAKFPKFRRVKLYFGEPFYPWEKFDVNSKDYLAKATEYLSKEIEKCMRKAEES